MRPLLRTVVVATTLLLGVTACSQVREAVDSALGAALRTAASEALKQAAQEQGFPLAGDPDCQGEVQSATKSATITCTAQAQAGDRVTSTVTITNAGDAQTCKGEMVITVGSQPPIRQNFPSCGG